MSRRGTIACLASTYGTGGDGTRTHDLRIANATLSQLSYAPEITIIHIHPAEN